MKDPFRIGFSGGLLGALIVIVMMYVVQTAGNGELPAFVSHYRAFFPSNPPFDHVVSALVYALSGGVWGVLYALTAKNPSMQSGALFGLLPTLWTWLAVAPVSGRELFHGFTVRGILLPLIYNVLVWGTFLGWYCSRRDAEPGPGIRADAVG